MKFGKRLSGAQRRDTAGWKFVDYALLKYKIATASKERSLVVRAEFLTELQKELCLVSDNFALIVSELERQIQDATCDPEEANSCADKILCFINDANRAREYVNWNYMAVIKIVKKFNKYMKDISGHKDIDALTILMNTAFYNCPKLAQLITLAEEILMKVGGAALIPRDNVVCSVCLDVLCKPVSFLFIYLLLFVWFGLVWFLFFLLFLLSFHECAK
jgi:hypothetical protein